MKERSIYDAIDLYFDAQLSIEEEEKLFRTLLRFKGDDPKADEALAVMIMTHMGGIPDENRLCSPHDKKLRPFSLRHIYAAVAIALIAVCTTALLHHYHGAAADEIEGMMAYVGGVRVSDRAEIMKIVDDQLNDIGMSSEMFAQTVAADLDDISDAFKDKEL